MNEVILNIQGFEGRDFKIIDGGAMKGAAAYIDGQKVKLEKGKLKVKDNQGQEVLIIPNHGPMMMDPWCGVKIKDQVIRLREPLKWYQYCLGGWPMLMVGFGGAIGGALGFMASYFNLSIFRSRLNFPLKLIFTQLIGIASIFTWLAVGLFVTVKTDPEKMREFQQAYQEGYNSAVNSQEPEQQQQADSEEAEEIVSDNSQPESEAIVEDTGSEFTGNLSEMENTDAVVVSEPEPAADMPEELAAPLEKPEQQPQEAPQPITEEIKNDSAALLAAVQDADITRITELINAGEEINQKTKEGKSALYLAVEAKNQEMAALLLKSPSIDVNAADKRGLSPLHVAAKDGNLAMVKLLIKSGANSRLLDVNGLTPAYHARLNGYTEVYNYLTSGKK